MLNKFFKVDLVFFDGDIFFFFELIDYFDLDFEFDFDVLELSENLLLCVCSISGVFFFYSLYDFCIVFFFFDDNCVILFKSL